MDKEYNKISVNPLFEISSIIYIVNNQSTCRIAPRSSHYSFWQIYYVSKGEVSVSRDEEELIIPAGSAYLFSPRKDLRKLKRTKEDNRFFVISFESDSPLLYEMCDKLLPLYGSEANLIFEICSTGTKNLEPIKHDGEKQGLCEKIGSHPAALQFLKVSLEQFLLKVYCRSKNISALYDESEKKNRANYEKGLVQKANSYMMENISRKLSISEIAKALSVNETTLRITYKKETGTSIIKAFSGMKLLEADRLIYETDLNFTQIAQKLGFLSIYHFSRFFKEHMGITLSEYSKTMIEKEACRYTHTASGLNSAPEKAARD